MRARVLVPTCVREPLSARALSPCLCIFARVSVHAREYFVCASAGEAKRERGEAGKRAFSWWEVGALVSTGTCGRQFRVNFLIQLPFERASLDSFSGMEVGHWSLMHWGRSPDFFQMERAPAL